MYRQNTVAHLRGAKWRPTMWPHGRRECAHDSLVDPRSGLQSSRQNDPAFGTVQLYRFAEQSAVERRMKPWDEGFGGDEAGRISPLHTYSHKNLNPQRMRKKPGLRRPGQSRKPAAA